MSDKGVIEEGYDRWYPFIMLFEVHGSEQEKKQDKEGKGSGIVVYFEKETIWALMRQWAWYEIHNKGEDAFKIYSTATYSLHSDLHIL